MYSWARCDTSDIFVINLITAGNDGEDDDDDDNAELSDEEAADGDAAEIKLRQNREQVTSRFQTRITPR